jgi:hypothetical protein
VTEAEWLECADPFPMLAVLRERGWQNDRRLRLFAAACSRRIWDRIDEFGRAAVEMAEAFADGQATEDELRAARHSCKAAGQGASWYAAVSDPAIAARNAALSAQSGADVEIERKAQAELLRDIFDNPFQSFRAIGPAFRTPAVTELASTIYERRLFARLPELAVMLAALGCADSDLLAHLRSSGAHVRGCWALDRLTQSTSDE